MSEQTRVEVLAVMDFVPQALDLDGNARLAGDMREARAAFVDLIEADREYDAAIEHLKDLNRKIEDRGWMEIQHDALREAGMRLVRAQAQRADALLRIGGAK